MKAKFQNRKLLQEMATRMGLYDETVLTAQEKPGTKEAYFELVNNQRRFVRGILKLPLERQNLRIKVLEERILMAEAAHRYKLEQEQKAKTEAATQSPATEGQKEE